MVQFDGTGPRPHAEQWNGASHRCGPRSRTTPARRSRPSNEVAETRLGGGSAVERAGRTPVPARGRSRDRRKERPFRRPSGTRTPSNRNLQEEAAPEPEPEAEPDGEEASNGFPDISKHDRLGWSLARLQRALSNVPRRRSGNTESWHRARITPELTISARNLADVDAHLLDSVSRMLKQLLWEAWEE